MERQPQTAEEAAMVVDSQRDTGFDYHMMDNL